MPKVHSSSVTNFVNFAVESVDYPGGVSRILIRGTGGQRLAAATLRALVARFDTYYGTTLTAAQVQTLLANANGDLLHLTQYNASFVVLTADLGVVATGLTSDLQTAGGVVSG